MIKEDKYYEDAWYKVCYERLYHRINFRATKIIEMDEEKIEDSKLEPQHQIEGFIKSDGCMEFEQDEHYCGLQQAQQTYSLMQRIYDYAESFFEKH